MRYIVNEKCPSCGGIYDVDDEDCGHGEYSCKCDEWSNTDPIPGAVGSGPVVYPENNNKKK